MEDIIYVKKEDIEYMQFKRLLDYGINNCYTFKLYDVNYRTENVNFDDSCKKICKSLDIELNTLISPKQTHSDNIGIVKNVDEKFDDTDALITSNKNINLMLKFADCTPILLFDYEKRIIANVHSGWRGTVQKIVLKTIDKMVKEFGCNPLNIIACIGPCIKECHFEVEDDVKEIFEKEFSYLNVNDKIIKESLDKQGKYYIDTTLINDLMLQQAGVKKENICICNLCTVCNSDIMHSYRAEGSNAGRNVAIIGM